LLAGAEIVDTAKEVFAVADLIVKIKEPQLSEWSRLRERQILFNLTSSRPGPGASQDAPGRRLRLLGRLRSCEIRKTDDCRFLLTVTPWSHQATDAIMARNCEVQIVVVSSPGSVLPISCAHRR
jgi:Alanine dehydrogenase/PNT, N-terminal domain